MTDMGKKMKPDRPKWLPADTCPKNGELVLIWFNEDYQIAWAPSKEEDWFSFMGTPMRPAVWTPLPARRPKDKRRNPSRSNP